jgi:hypothetical protein
MQFISTRILYPLQDLGSIILAYREAEASLDIFNDLMQKEPEYRPEEPVQIGDIESFASTVSLSGTRRQRPMLSRISPSKLPGVIR